MKKLFLFSFLILLATEIFCQSGEVAIPGSQLKKFTSSIVNGQEYLLQISLPAGYEKSNKKYPVVYLMDAQWDFGLLTALYGQQYFDGFIPELIVVGITWGGKDPNPDSLRARDYTPTNEKRLPQSGGADKFLSVIKNEIFPIVESNYRTDTNDKTLVGCSLGGLFALYSLFTHPDMFNRYVAASPALMWGNNVLYKYEEQYHTITTNSSAKLFICAGGVESSVPGFKKLASFLNDRQYANLQIESKVLDNTGHSGTKGEGYARGLQFVFKQPSLVLSPDLLQQYSGDYKSAETTIVHIQIADGKLTIADDTTRIVLTAASETDFYLTSSFFKIRFVKPDSKNVSGFELARFGSNSFFGKVK